MEEKEFQMLSEGSESSYAASGRELLLKAGRGVLSTIEEKSGFPFGSLVGYAVDPEGNPLIFISMIAEHWKNLAADPRASLLISDPDTRTPLSSARLTLLARFVRCPDNEQAQLAERYHEVFKKTVPSTIAGNFAFLRGEVERLRWIGGFGQAGWIGREAWRGVFK